MGNTIKCLNCKITYQPHDDEDEACKNPNDMRLSIKNVCPNCRFIMEFASESSNYKDTATIISDELSPEYLEQIEKSQDMVLYIYNEQWKRYKKRSK